MANEAQLKRTKAEIFDHALRMWVPSRTKNKRYLVQLDSYDANGECQCVHFATRLEPILKQAISPEEAVQRKLVSLKNRKTGETRQIWDSLRCHHIIEARAEWADVTIRGVAAAENRNRPKGYREP